MVVWCRVQCCICRFPWACVVPPTCCEFLGPSVSPTVPGWLSRLVHKSLILQIVQQTAMCDLHVHCVVSFAQGIALPTVSQG